MPDVVALVREILVPEAEVKLKVGIVPYPVSVRLVLETFVSAALVEFNVGKMP